MLKSAIIGAGSIGALKPDKYDYPGGERVLTIAHAMYNHPSVKLEWIIDTDTKKAELASYKWGCRSGLSLKDISEQMAIIAVCTPTHTHYEVLKEVLALENPPKVIIAEKPFCNNYKEAQEIVEACKAKNIILMIDYIRRYDWAHQQLAMDLQHQKIHNVNLTYTRGLCHEACHAFDLFNWWLGDFKSIKLFSDSAISDRDILDPAVGAVASYERCPFVSMAPVDGRDYAVFDIEIYTDTKKYVLADHGQKLFIYSTEPDSYGNYRCMSPWPIALEKTGLSQALEALVHNAYMCLTLKGEKPLCSGEDALAVHKIYKYLEDNKI